MNASTVKPDFLRVYESGTHALLAQERLRVAPTDGSDRVGAYASCVKSK